jgi:hypothetical protein
MQRWVICGVMILFMAMATAALAAMTETVVAASGTLTPGTYGVTGLSLAAGTTGIGIKVDKDSIINNIGLVVIASVWVSYDNGATFPSLPNGTIGLKCTDNPAAPGTCKEGVPSADPYFVVSINPPCNTTCQLKGQVTVEGANYTTAIKVIREFP